MYCTLNAKLRSENSFRLVLKKILLTGTYFLAAFVIEVITVAWLRIGIPQYWLLDLGVLLLISSLLSVVPGVTAQIVVMSVFLFVQIFLTAVNNTLYGMSNMVFSFSMLNVIGEAGNVFSADMVNFLLIGVLILLYGAAVYGFVAINKKFFAVNDLVLQTVAVLLLVFFVSLLASAGLVFVTRDHFQRDDPEDMLYMYNDDLFLWETQFITGTAYKKFGTFGFYVKNIMNFVTGGSYAKEKIALNEKLTELDEYFGEGQWSGTLAPYGDGLLMGECAGMNVVLVVIESGEWFDINAEYTPTLYAMAKQGYAMTEYYARDKTNHSEAMSILGSFPVDLDNSIVPSLNNPEGLLEHNFAFTSANILKRDGYTTNYFHANDSAFYSRGKTHGALYGFEHLNFLDEMSRLCGYYGKSSFYDFDRDSEMLSQYLDSFVRKDEGDSAFFTMMLSLISHGNYMDLVTHGDYTAELSEAQKQALSAKYSMKGLEQYYEVIDSYPETYIDDRFAIGLSERDEQGELTDTYLEYKRQQAGIMDLDVGLNRLVHYLDESGELENTVFMLYADHFSYYQDLSYALKGIPTEYSWDTALHNIPFFVWSGKMDLDVQNIYEGVTYSNTDPKIDSVYAGDFYYAVSHRGEGAGGVVVTKPCNSFDLLPTLLDMLGYEYNTNLYQGTSVFREGTNAFISRESGIFSKDIYFDSDTVYLAADTQDGTTVSSDGQITVQGQTVRVVRDGVTVEYPLPAEGGGIAVHESGKYIEIDISVGQKYLSDFAVDFLLKVNRYYEKRAKLEDMYRYDYFSYREIGDFVRKISA